jgi:hypothetical protein
MVLCVLMITRSGALDVGGAQIIDRVWVGSLDRCQALLQGQHSTGEGSDRMKRGCFRVSPLGTDVKRVVAHRGAPVGRCLGIEASLSLSLSLSCPSSASPLAADFARTPRRLELPVRGGPRSVWGGLECPAAAIDGVPRLCEVARDRTRGCTAASRLAGRGLFERRCHPHLAPAFEEAPSRAPTRVGYAGSAGRRGLDPRPRRSGRQLTQMIRAHAHNNWEVAS